jgi:hypothetical protein
MASRKMASRRVWRRKEAALDMVTRKLSLCAVCTLDEEVIVGNHSNQLS